MNFTICLSVWGQINGLRAAIATKDRAVIEHVLDHIHDTSMFYTLWDDVRLIVASSWSDSSLASSRAWPWGVLYNNWMRSYLLRSYLASSKRQVRSKLQRTVIVILLSMWPVACFVCARWSIFSVFFLNRSQRSWKW